MSFILRLLLLPVMLPMAAVFLGLWWLLDRAFKAPEHRVPSATYRDFFVHLIQGKLN